MTRKLALLCSVMLLLCSILPGSLAEETRIDPVEIVPDYVEWLLEVASGEVGYREGAHGYSKYGEWSGDPYAQWCAEFLCWCVDQVDQQHGTHLLDRVFPLYSSQNVGRAWFIRAGRFIVRNGEVDGWGHEWIKGKSTYVRVGDYIPQPGDYVFFTWTSGTDTDHVALVEYCTRDDEGKVRIHVIEGNNPVAVARNIYSLSDTQILGYGTVHDLAEITMRYGNSGEKVRQLQESLAYLDYLEDRFVTGDFGNATVSAVRAFQNAHGLKPNAVANYETQTRLQEEVEKKKDLDPATWTVVDEDD